MFTKDSNDYVNLFFIRSQSFVGKRFKFPATPDRLVGMRKQYSHETKAGTFYIGEVDGRTHVMFNEVSLGKYPSAKNAAENIAGGYAFSPPAGLDTSKLGLPRSLNEWHRLDDLGIAGLQPTTEFLS